MHFHSKNYLSMVMAEQGQISKQSQHNLQNSGDLIDILPFSIIKTLVGHIYAHSPHFEPSQHLLSSFMLTMMAYLTKKHLLKIYKIFSSINV